MGNAAQNKAFDLSSFLGSMFGEYQNTPEARNDFGIGNINEILDTQLKTQRLAGQAAGQQAYNNTAAATALGERTARNQQARNQQDAARQQARNNANAPNSGGSISGYADGRLIYRPNISGPPEAPRVTMQQTTNPLFARDILQSQLRRTEANNNTGNDRSLIRANTTSALQKQRQQGKISQIQQLEQLASNKELAQIEAQARLGSAQIGMQGQILGSLFNSIGSGSPNYRYW